MTIRAVSDDSVCGEVLRVIHDALATGRLSPTECDIIADLCWHTEVSDRLRFTLEEGGAYRQRRIRHTVPSKVGPPGPMGPKGEKGDTGPQGPAGMPGYGGYPISVPSVFTPVQTVGGCSCPPGTVCANVACPYRTTVTCSTAMGTAAAGQTALRHAADSPAYGAT